MFDDPIPPGADVPDDLDNLVLLSPEQYEALLKAREEQHRDLTREEWEAVLKALEEQS